MRIGLDIRMLHFARTGFYRYVKGLLASAVALAPAGELILLQHPEFRPREACFRKFRSIDLNTPLFAEDEAAEFNREVRRHGFDLIHFPCSLSLPVEECEALLTLHDLTCIKYPKSVQAKYRPYYVNTLSELGRVRYVCVDSTTVMNELLATGYRHDRIQRIYPATPFEQRALRQPALWHVIETEQGKVELQPGGYILSVGATDPRKNLPTLLRGYRMLRAGSRKPPRLVLVTHHGWDGGELASLVSNLDFRDEIHVAARVNDSQLAALYRHCSSCVFSSYYEGFGFVPLEALRHGAPLISSATPSLVEAGYPEECLVDPMDWRGFARAMLSACAERGEFLNRQSVHARRVSRYYRQQGSFRMVAAYHKMLQTEER